jgi:hypothetical protein
MRDIRFRAWDGLNLVEKLRVGKIELFDDMLGFRFQHFDSDPEEIIFEEWTGMRDRKNNDIYEGDILRFDVAAILPGRKPLINERGIVTIRPLQTCYGQWEANYCTNVRVIGNIHENPNLMNAP